MSSKANVWRLVCDHLDTFTDQATGRRSVADWSFFFGIPALFAVFGLMTDFKIGKDVLNLLVNAFSILAGLFVNVLVLLYSLTQERANYEELEKQLIRELFVNVSYLILTSILSVIIIVINGYTEESAILTAVLVFLGLNFVLTVLMAVKRLYVLLQKRLP